MKFENEITVEVTCSLEELMNILKNFNEVETYDINDIYMINKENKKEENILKKLKSCLLIRHIIEENKETKKLTYKYKEYDEDGNITKQGKVETNIDEVENTKLLLEHVDFEEFIKIYDHSIVVCNSEDEFVIQNVNNKHIYIELEEECQHIDKKYNSIEEMKEVLNKYNIPIKNDNYFAKKAEIEALERYSVK